MDIRKALRNIAHRARIAFSSPSYLASAFAYIIRSKRNPFLPIMIDIEPNNYCNFKCPHCQVTHWKKEKTRLTKEAFVRILDQLPGLRRIKLQGMGEPLLNNEFIDMLAEGEKRGILMRFFSNASLCDNAAAERLVKLKKTDIIFSLDAADPATFAKIRVGGDLEKVKENVRNIVRLRGKDRRPALEAWIVVTRENKAEIRQVIQLAKELGLDRITLQVFLTDWGKREMKGYISSISVGKDLQDMKNICSVAKKAGRESGIDVEIAQYDGCFSARRPCHWPWMSAYIASNGDVVPCCVLANSDIVKMGNVFEEDFARIWNSKKYVEFREKIRIGMMPDFCRNCYKDIRKTKGD